jgi:hypothetical protein
MRQAGEGHLTVSMDLVTLSDLATYVATGRQ